MENRIITIKPSPMADSRTADGPVTKRQLWEASIQHIGDVCHAMAFFGQMIVDTARRHDNTKVDPEGIDAFYDSFSKGLQGDEFKKEPWFQRHITEERHHLTDRVPDDVNLIDILERVADITMAAMGRNGDIGEVDIDTEILLRAYKNTVLLLKNNTKIECDK